MYQCQDCKQFMSEHRPTCECGNILIDVFSKDALEHRLITIVKSEYGHGEYFKRKYMTPKVEVCISSTNEPMLNEVLESWKAQTIKDIKVHVNIDCAENESWDIARSFNDDRFTFTLSPTLQGLARVWNQRISVSKSPYFTCSVGDIIVPPNLLEMSIQNLQNGWVIPTPQANSNDDCLWVHVIKNDALSLFDESWGPGSGLVIDWRIRANARGWKGVKLLNLKIPQSPYSILDKIPFEEAEPQVADGRLDENRFRAAERMKNEIELRT